MALDITTEKLADMVTARSEARFRALIENNRDAIMVRDRDRNLVYSSPSMARMLGFEMHEIEAYRAPETLIYEEDIPLLRKLYMDSESLPGVSLPTVLRMKHKNGNYIWVEGVMTNMLDVAEVRGFVCNLHDITQRVEMDLQNQKISNDLVQHNENLEQYAYIVSHNLRAPIANLLGLANLLDLPTVSQPDKDYALKHIISSARRLDEVIKDLSSILQSNEEVSQHRESLRFEDLVKNICESIQSAIEINNVCISTDFSECAGIVSIKSYLYSIFYNLISNSIKYRQRDVPPLISIKSQRDNGRTVITFEDNGLGLDLATYGDKVFGLYRRFHPEQAEGKGMGLFMVRKQVENLGGKISVRSVVGRGTVFTIEL